MKHLYLHGFNSSPESAKAKIFKKFLSTKDTKNLITPNLPISPSDSINLLSKIIDEEDKKLSIIGSSLGGFYAAYLGNKYGIKSVLINPVVPGHLESMKEIIGEHSNYKSNEKYRFTESHYRELLDLKINDLKHPMNHFCLVQLGDEVLDQKLTINYFKNSLILIEKDGNHQYSEFERYLNLIYDFMTI
ncbi:MAG: hypothetical protein CMK55_05105 [Proteobacteria bacterium]|nr:hypothetical protein [Pseudomonadota bacterium]